MELQQGRQQRLACSESIQAAESCQLLNSRPKGSRNSSVEKFPPGFDLLASTGFCLYNALPVELGDCGLKADLTNIGLIFAKRRLA
jgi:hypothetical protein